MLPKGQGEQICYPSKGMLENTTNCSDVDETEGTSRLAFTLELPLCQSNPNSVLK